MVREYKCALSTLKGQQVKSCREHFLRKLKRMWRERRKSCLRIMLKRIKKKSFYWACTKNQKQQNQTTETKLVKQEKWPNKMTKTIRKLKKKESIIMKWMSRGVRFQPSYSCGFDYGLLLIYLTGKLSYLLIAIDLAWGLEETLI